MNSCWKKIARKMKRWMFARSIEKMTLFEMECESIILFWVHSNIRSMWGMNSLNLPRLRRSKKKAAPRSRWRRGPAITGFDAAQRTFGPACLFLIIHTIPINTDLNKSGKNLECARDLQRYSYLCYDLTTNMQNSQSTLFISRLFFHWRGISYE